MKNFFNKHKDAIKRIVLLPNVLDYKTETTRFSLSPKLSHEGWSLEAERLIYQARSVEESKKTLERLFCRKS